jgi:hypothetical protein
MMLSRYDHDRLLVVLQIEHSHAAGLVMAHWGNETFARPEPFNAVVVATGGHDSAWWDWEIRPTLNEQGHLIDYYRSNEVLGQVWVDFTTDWIERLARRDPYAAYLVSMHHEGLLSGGFGVLPNMPDRRNEQVVQEFARVQQAFRRGLHDQLVRSERYGRYMTDEHLWRNYKLVQVGDRLGQLLCNRHPFNSTERRTGPGTTLDNIPVAPGMEDTTLTLDIQDETRAIVRPYPFDVDRLEINIAGRLVPLKSYADEEEFVGDYLHAERVSITRVLERG